MFDLDGKPPLAGILRVTCDAERNPIITGDLYARQGPFNAATISPGTLPIANWRYYIRCTRFWAPTSRGERILEWEFNSESQDILTRDGSWRTIMTAVAAPAGASVEAFNGSIYQDSGGSILGKWQMVRISRHLRELDVEIHTATGCPAPPDSNSSARWGEAFSDAGWKVEARHVANPLPGGNKQSWSAAELHDAMLQARANSGVSTSWVARLLVVPHLTDTARGIMFDMDGADTNNLPREGAAVAAEWTVPPTPEWGRVHPLFHRNTDLYLRTILHELGHVLNLNHDDSDNGVMCTTDVIAERASAARPASALAAAGFHFSPQNRRDLMHWTDRLVRPGDWRYTQALAEDSAHVATAPPDLDLSVRPILDVLPIGAPVRVDLTLRNAGASSAFVPTGIGMKSGFLRGTVTDPSGGRRHFSPIYVCMDGGESKELRPGGRFQDSATLWRGRDGPLFPGIGYHRLDLALEWRTPNGPVRLNASCSVMLTPAPNPGHAKAALELLRSEDLLLLLAIGGDHHKMAETAIAAALRCRSLRPHWLYTEINRLARPHFSRKPAWKEILRLLAGKGSIVTSRKEARKLFQWRKKFAAGSDR